VTEMITGLDLIQEQVRAAQGEVLRYKQEDIKIKVTTTNSQCRGFVMLREIQKCVLGSEAQLQIQHSMLARLPALSSALLFCIAALDEQSASADMLEAKHCAAH